MEITLRPYQVEAETASEKKFKPGNTRHLFVLSTGTGKRILGVSLSRKWNRTIFICHREELMQQAFEDFNSLYPGNVGFIKGPNFEINKKVVIASAQTLWRRLDKIPEDWFDCVQVDEAHHFMAKTFVKPLNYFTPKISYLFTATPYRLDGLGLSHIADEIVYEYPLKKAIEEKYLCSLNAWRIRTDVTLENVRKVAGDFNQKQLSQSVDIPARNKLIVDSFIKFAPNRQAVAFCVDIKHSENLAEMFREKGFKAEAIHSKLHGDRRRWLNERFKTGELEILTNVEILTEGWDYNDVGALLMARPTQSIAMYMQMIGRGTRLKSEKLIKAIGKNECTVLDFVDMSGRHKIVNTWELDKHKDAKNMIFISKERKEKKQEDVQRRNIRLKKLYGHTEIANLFALPVIKIRHTGRMNEDATPKQIEVIKKAGLYDPENVYTKGLASEHISNLPAHEYQIKQLAEIGYRIHDQKVTYGQYTKALQEHNKKKEKKNKFNGVAKSFIDTSVPQKSDDDW